MKGRIPALIFLLIGTSASASSPQSYGFGFLFPDTGRLGAGNVRIDLVDLIVSASFSYGITDYVDVEIGDILFTMGNFGFRIHSPTLGKNNKFDFALVTRAFFLPKNSPTTDNRNAQIGAGLMGAFSWKRSWLKVTLSAGYAFINNYPDGTGGAIMVAMQPRKNLAFLTEFAGIAVPESEGTFVAMGLFAGPRFIIPRGAIDAGLLFPFLKESSSDHFEFPIVLPVLNFHLTF